MTAYASVTQYAVADAAGVVVSPWWEGEDAYRDARRDLKLLHPFGDHRVVSCEVVRVGEPKAVLP